jgi:hypothetical protein
MPTYRTINEYKLTLAYRILQLYPSGFIGAIIEGERGYGKSSYAMKVMAQVYKTLEGLTDEDAWERSIDNMIFSMDDLIKVINHNIEHDIVTPTFCLDDATVHFSSYKFFTNLYEVILIHGMFDTIRTACTGLLLTCPKRDLLLAALRNYDDFKIEIYKNDGWQRIARGYKMKTTPIGQRRTYKNFEDMYSCYLPDWVFEKYMTKRKFYLKQTNDELQKILNNKDEKKKISVVQGQLQKITLQRKVDKIKKSLGLPEVDNIENSP